MDNLLKLKLVLFIGSLPSLALAAPFVPGGFVDGPAPATYERTPTSMKIYVDMPKYGGHAAYTLDSSAPNTKGGSYIAPKSVDMGGGTIKPQLSTNVKIPYANAAGAAVAATLTMPLLKSTMAKAAVTMIRAQPAVATLLTFGWLANAGYEYLSSLDAFQTIASGTPTGSITGSCRGINGTILSGSMTMDACLSLVKSTYTAYTFGSPTKADSCNYSLSYTVNGNTQIRNPWWTNASPCTDDPNPTGAVISPAVPVTETQVLDGLNVKPVSGTVDTPTTIDNELGELIKMDYIPDKDPASGPKLTGPNGETSITKQGDETITTTPDGATRAERLAYQTQFADDHAEVMEMLTITDTPASGTPTTTTVSRPPEVSTATTQNQTPTTPAKTDCEKFPKNIGCSQYGTVSAPDVIPVTNVSLSINPTSLGTGTCPTPKTITLVNGKTITMSYQPYCDFAVKLNPVLIAFAWLSAGLIVLGPIREA